jgi:hypothetical protein
VKSCASVETPGAAVNHAHIWNKIQERKSKILSAPWVCSIYLDLCNLAKNAELPRAKTLCLGKLAVFGVLFDWLRQRPMCRANETIWKSCPRIAPNLRKTDSSKVGAAKVGVAEVGAAEVGVAEIGVAEVGAAEVGVAKVGAAEIR